MGLVFTACEFIQEFPLYFLLRATLFNFQERITRQLNLREVSGEPTVVRLYECALAAVLVSIANSHSGYKVRGLGGGHYGMSLVNVQHAKGAHQHL